MNIYIHNHKTNDNDINLALQKSLYDIYNTFTDYFVYIGENLDTRFVDYNYKNINKAINDCLYRNVVYSVELIYNMCKQHIKNHTKQEIEKEVWIKEYMYSLYQYGFENKEYNLCDDLYIGTHDEIYEEFTSLFKSGFTFLVDKDDQNELGFNINGYFFCIIKEVNNFGEFIEDDKKKFNRQFFNDFCIKNQKTNDFILYGEEKQDSINDIISYNKDIDLEKYDE